VEKNQTKIYNMVMDMLSFSKDREPALEPSDLNETVNDVVELMQARASELGVGLTLSLCETMPRVMIDPEGIHRAVLNIVTNAIDASEGQSDARVTVATEWDTDAWSARVRVADNGVGIDESDIGSIFQIFASSKGSRGTGLGLPVSRKIVAEHGGSITVTSQSGHGSTFLIDLPMTRKTAPSETGEGLTMMG
jgi:signal transduction histidine kinase